MSNDVDLRCAHANLLRLINVNERFPLDIFHKKWDSYLFFESDFLFSDRFQDVAHNLLKAEGSQICYLLNFSESHTLDFDRASNYHFCLKEGNASYRKFLLGDTPATGWLYRMDRYGCCSETGDWCIYCEKENDVAVLALMSPDRFKIAIDRLEAESIGDLIRASDRFPFNELTSEWLEALRVNYGGLS